MTDPDTDRQPTGTSREDRLKAALKANLARRKAQTRARAGTARSADRTDESED